MDDFLWMAEESRDLGELLADALYLKKHDGCPKDGRLRPVKSIKDFLETRLNLLLLEENKIEADLFLCASYAAGAIEELSRENIHQHRFTAIEGLWRNSQGAGRPEKLAHGGKICFFIAVFCPQIHRRRVVSEDYYRETGQALFYQHYLATGRHITYCMSEYFPLLVSLTREALAD